VTVKPQKSLLLTRPRGQDTVLVHIDGRPANMDETARSRLFLANWRQAAERVRGAPATLNVTREAMLIEMPTLEPDEDGRMVPTVLWCRPHLDPEELVRQLAEFTAKAGRTLDVGLARSALQAGFRAAALSRHRRAGCRPGIRRFLATLRGI
jgi:hypothetical protein